MSTITVAVIIPYYQTKTGVLRRALDSVLQQRLPPNVQVEVIVVDDGSPIPAQTEIEGLNFAPPFHLTLKEQPNGGVAAARNTGLRRVSEETTYIALLDSDDIWDHAHLTTAIAALNRGCDFYFCDSQRITLPHTAFTCSAEKAFSHFLQKHAKNLGGNVYELDCQPFFDECIRTRLFDTSTAVYRRSVAPDLAFDPSIRLAGEDCLFFYQLILKCRHIFCCTKVMVTLADGVNIASSKFGWDDPGHLLLHMAQILACYKFRDQLPLSPTLRSFMKYKIRMLRAKFAFFTIRYFVKTRELWTQDLIDMVHSDRRFILWYPLYALYVTVCFPLHLYDPLKNW